MKLFLIWIIFVQEQKELSLKRLEKLYQNLDTGMTQDKYLDMMEQLGKNPVPEELPPGFDDLPEIMQIAISSFNLMGDRIYPEIGYVGKDYTNLKHFIEIYEVEDIEFFLEILNWLDSRAIKKSSEQLKKEMDKARKGPWPTKLS